MWRSIGMDLWGVLSCGFEGVWAVCGEGELVECIKRINKITSYLFVLLCEINFKTEN